MRRALPAMGLAFLLGGCGGSGRSATGVQVTIVKEAGAGPGTSPGYVEITVLAADTPIANKRLPEAGNLPPPTTEGALGVVLVELTPSQAGALKVIARGKTDATGGAMLVAEAAARTAALVGTWREVVLVLKAGALPDMDDDGLPDSVDDCPKDATFRCGVAPDGGITALPNDAGP